jgi:hypothetical protein
MNRDTTITVGTLVDNTYNFPQGCEDQKNAFLRTFGIEDPQSLKQKKPTIIVEGWYHDIEGLQYETLESGWREIGLGNKVDCLRKVRSNVSSLYEIEVEDAAKVIEFFGIGNDEFRTVPDREYARLRANLTLANVA